MLCFVAGSPRPTLLFAAIVLAVSASGCSGGNGSDFTSPERVAERAELTAMSATYAASGLAEIRADAAAMDLGSKLFTAWCADCHGDDGTGDKGVTNLTAGRFEYGASADAIRTTIRDGRDSMMPRMGGQYGEVELGQIVAYVETLGTGNELSDYESRGQSFYAESCVTCHGENGRGVTALGAPDLTDDYWQHGDSMMNKRLVITRGVQSECPSHGAQLSAAEIELLTAHVLELSSN